MVDGFPSFREHFQGYEDCYVIIGGTACTLFMEEAALEFRATRDVDMVLLLENRFEEFAGHFWRYIKAGQYRCGWRNSAPPHFYRFTEPVPAGYPKMIELFSRRPDFQANHPELHLTPLPVSEEISSLSAIMLEDSYYRLLLAGRQTVNGVSALSPEYLILFKARAWLDLTRRKAEGGHVNERDWKKHKNDIFRLFALIDPMKRIPLPPAAAGDMQAFLDAVAGEQIPLRDFGIKTVTLEEILHTLRTVFGLPSEKEPVARPSGCFS